MLTIQADIRKKKKTAESRRLRKQNRCPAIIYKNTQYSNLSISLDHNEIQHPKIIIHFYKNKQLKLLINKDTILVKIQDIQYHPCKLQIIHIDFLLI